MCSHRRSASTELFYKRSRSPEDESTDFLSSEGDIVYDCRLFKFWDRWICSGSGSEMKQDKTIPEGEQL